MQEAGDEARMVSLRNEINHAMGRISGGGGAVYPMGERGRPSVGLQGMLRVLPCSSGAAWRIWLSPSGGYWRSTVNLRPE